MYEYKCKLVKVVDGDTIDVDLDLGYTKKFIYSPSQDLIINIYGSNLLNQAIRNHASLIKDHVPLQGKSVGVDVSLRYKF